MEMMQKNFASVCIISHGGFQRQNGIYNEISVLDHFYGPFGRSINVSVSHFFNRKILFLPFLGKKRNDAELGGNKILHGVFEISNVKIIEKIVNSKSLIWSLGRSMNHTNL